MQQVVTRAPCGLSKYPYHALHAFKTSAPELEKQRLREAGAALGAVRARNNVP